MVQSNYNQLTMETTNALDAEAIAAAVERERVAPRNYTMEGFQYIWKIIQEMQCFLLYALLWQ